MALNNDFKVKNSLYVGNSAYFVTQTDTPTILSAGNSLFDIFLQEGEGGSGILSDGDGITDFMFDSLSAATVAVDATVLRSTGSTFTGVLSANIAGGRYLSAGSDFSELFSNCQGTVTSVTGGNGIDSTGGTTPQISISGGDGITSSSQDIHVDSTVIRTTGNQTIGDTKTFTALTPFNAGLTAAVGGVGTIGLSATAANSGILSAGKDLNEIFQIIGSDSRGKVLSEGIGIQDFTYEGLSAQTVAVSQGILSGGASHLQGTLTLSGAGGTGYNTTIDLGLQTGDTPNFAGVTGGNVTVGLANNQQVCTTSGELQLQSATNSTRLVDSTIVIPNVGAGTSNNVLVKNGSDQIKTDVIDSKVWAGALIDGGGSTGRIAKFSGSKTIAQSIMDEKAAGGGFDIASINVLGGLSALSLSGDGAGLNNVTATAIFPSTIKTTLGGGDKFFINDGANKHTTYTALLTSFGGGVGLTTSGTCLAVNGAAALDTNNLPRWNGSGFVNSIVKQTAAGNVNIAGGTTISGNLSVTGDFTCIETTISTTSALSVTNTGTGPALFVCQTGSQPIAHFIDQDGGDIVFADDGKLGIGTFAPSEKLTLVGDLSGIGNSTITGTSNVFGLATLGGGITATLASGTSNNVVVSNSGSLVTDGIDCKVWVCKLVDYNALDANYIPKATDGAGTIGNSCITDTGSLVTINSDTKIDEGHNFQVFANVVTGATAFCSFTKKATFSTVVTSASSHSLPTFAKANLKQAKYNVTLIKGVNVTAFEVQAVYNNTTTCGTVYGIVDGQAATQLDTASICNSGSTIDLLLKSASSGTCAIVSGEALYLG